MKAELVEGAVHCLMKCSAEASATVLICITQDIRYHGTGQPIKPVSMET